MHKLFMKNVNNPPHILILLFASNPNHIFWLFGHPTIAFAAGLSRDRIPTNRTTARLALIPPND